jgi:hypothetical protein
MIILHHNAQDCDLNDHQYENMKCYNWKKIHIIYWLNDWCSMEEFGDTYEEFILKSSD